jgi:hypothetical protein
VTWFKNPGDTVELKWYYPPSTTIQTTVVTLAAFPPNLDGFDDANFSTSEVAIRSIPPMTRSASSSNNFHRMFRDLLENDYPVRDPSLWENQQLSRLTPAAYADGLNAPPAGRPNPRDISNAIFDTSSFGIENSDNLSDLFWLWGQFLDHDIDLSPAHEPAEGMNVSIPSGDPDFDPGNTGTVELSFERTIYDPATGVSSPREQMTIITPFIDATNVYGTKDDRNSWLREYSGGRLKTSQGNFPPLNDGTMDNAVSSNGQAPFVVGDVRGNENVGLLSLHALMLREHNRWAGLIVEREPSLNDEQVYQKKPLPGMNFFHCLLDKVLFQIMLDIILASTPKFQMNSLPEHIV